MYSTIYVDEELETLTITLVIVTSQKLNPGLESCQPSNFLLRAVFVTLTDHICIHMVVDSEYYLGDAEKIKETAMPPSMIDNPTSRFWNKKKHNPLMSEMRRVQA